MKKKKYLMPSMQVVHLEVSNMILALSKAETFTKASGEGNEDFEIESDELKLGWD